MKTRTKYNGSVTHRQAILHMVGQAQEIFGCAPKCAEIASWMNVSKPTARKYLNKMIDNKEIIMTKKPHRTCNKTGRVLARVYMYELHPDVMRDYADGFLETSYRIYTQRFL